MLPVADKLLGAELGSVLFLFSNLRYTVSATEYAAKSRRKREDGHG